jgi:hypothetical protein
MHACIHTYYIRRRRRRRRQFYKVVFANEES